MRNENRNPWQSRFLFSLFGRVKIYRLARSLHPFSRAATAAISPFLVSRTFALDIRSFDNMRTITPVLAPFHLAFPVHSIAAARGFYGELLGCPEGRSAADWVDFNFYGHQIVAHLAPEEAGHRKTSAVDGDNVPVRHFGVVLPMDQWHAAARKLTQAGIEFIIEPHVRFKGEVGEQATMFFLDPSGNALEIKAFADIASLFAR
jgi:extradiol dioxygenase family protein